MLFDASFFSDLCQDARFIDHQRFNIGTYKEKTIHLVLKNFLEPDPEQQEVPYKGYIADIKNARGIFEIQTSSFGSLRKKLEVFLESDEVTVVYPVPTIKWLSWIDESGSVSKKRRSPKRYSSAELLPNLVYIRDHLKSDHLHFLIFLLEVEEFRLLDGWGNNGKRGSTRFDRIPLNLIDSVYIHSAKDLPTLLPLEREEPFSVNDLAKGMKTSYQKAHAAVNALKYAEVIRPTMKKGNTILYECS